MPPPGRGIEDGEIVGWGWDCRYFILLANAHSPDIDHPPELVWLTRSRLTCGVDGLSDRASVPRIKFHTVLRYVGLFSQSLVDVGFLGGLEIDAYGNLNTTLLRRPKGKFRRFTARREEHIAPAPDVVITIRTRRQLNEAVSFITSPAICAVGMSERNWTAEAQPLITDRRLWFRPANNDEIRVHSS